MTDDEPAWKSAEPIARNDWNAKERNNPADIILQEEYHAREYAVAVERIKIMQARRGAAHRPPPLVAAPARRSCRHRMPSRRCRGLAGSAT